MNTSLIGAFPFPLPFTRPHLRYLICLLLLTFSLQVKAAPTQKDAIEKSEEDVIEIVSEDYTEAQSAVIDLNQRLFSLLKNDAEALKKDRTQLDKKMEEAIGELIDFRIIAARVMGKYYRKASRQQRIDFLRVFKKNLTNTYINGLLNSEDINALIQKLHVKIFPAKISSKTNNRARVETKLGVGKQNYQVIYSLYANKKTKNWLIENLEIEGINLGITLRNQFGVLMDRHNNRIDKVIDLWTSDVVDNEIADNKAKQQ